MSIANPIITSGFLPSLHVVKPSHYKSQTRISSISSNFASVILNPGQTGLFRGNARRVLQKNVTSRRRFRVCNAVEPGAPLPEPGFNFMHWIVGIAAVILPFFTHKWASLLKIKNEIDTAVEMAEDIVEAVEKAADEVEKVAEDIADDLPEGGRLRKIADFVENVAERASEDAHVVGDFIDKVQEAEERVEEYVESWGEEASTQEPHTEKDEDEDKEGGDREPPKVEKVTMSQPTN